MKKEFLIFVYDDCLNGMKNFHMLQGAKFHKHDVIPKYNLMVIDDIPMATKNKSVWNFSSKLYVESYYINEEIMKRLDEHYRVPDYFQRINIKSQRGLYGVIYIVKEKRSFFKGNAIIINKKWSDYFINKEKYDIKKKKWAEERKKLDEEDAKQAKIREEKIIKDKMTKRGKKDEKTN